MTLRRTLRAAAATSVLVAAAAACGDDASTSAPPQPTVTVTATPSAEAASPSAEATSPSAEATPTSSPTASAPVVIGPPGTYAEALARIEAARDVTGGGAQEIADFVTPSGNIFCTFGLDGLPVGCELREGTVPAPDVCSGAPTPDVGRVELQGGRAVPICNTDTITRPGAPTLAYGDAAYTRDTACVSEQIGVTCVSRSGQGGFFLHRGEYLLF